MKPLITFVVLLWALSCQTCPHEIAAESARPLLRGKTLDTQALYEAMLLARRGDADAQNRVLGALAQVIPRQIAARMRMSPERLDDVVQEILFRIVRRNFDFEPSKGMYTTWMFWYIRACAKIPKHLLLEMNGSNFGDEESDFMATVVDHRPLAPNDDLTAARKALALLQTQDAQLVSWHVMEGRKLRETAAELGLSRFQLNARIDIAKIRLAQRVRQLNNAQLAPVLDRVPAIPDKFKDIFIAVSLDGIELNAEFCTARGYKEWKSCIRSYFVAVGHMANGLVNGTIAPFWNGILELPGPYRWVETAIVDHYLATGEYPNEENTAPLAAGFEVTPDRLYGQKVANPNTGPNSMRVFWGKDHVFWMFHRFLQRLEGAKEDVPALRPFNPVEWGRPQQVTPYRALAQEVFSERAYLPQLQVVTAAVDFFKANGRLPDARTELPGLCGIHANQLFSYGSEYQPGGRWEGFGVFSGVEEYETMLEARRAVLLQHAEEEDLPWLENMGRARFTRLQYQSPLPHLFVFQYPVVSRYFEILTPLEQRVFILRAEQKLTDEQVAIQMGVDKKKAQLLCITGLARIEKHIRKSIGEEEAQAYAKELLDLPGPHRETALALVEAFGKTGRFATEENIRGLLKENFSFTAAKLVGSRLNVHAEKLHVRLFFGIHHMQWMVLELMDRERKRLETRSSLTGTQRVYLDRYNAWTIHQMDVTRHTDAYTPLLIKWYETDRERELARLANGMLDAYLATGAAPTGNRLISLTGIHRERLFGGNNQRSGQVRKFYFDDREHYHSQLEAARIARLGALAADATKEREALERLPLLIYDSNGTENGSACEVPEWLKAAFDALIVEHQRALCLRAIQGHSEAEVAKLMGLDPTAATDSYLSALNSLARQFERMDSTENLEQFLIWALERPGPQRDFVQTLVARFADDPYFFPSAETLDEHLDWTDFPLGRDQMLGVGDYGPNRRLARVFYGPFHLMWAYERVLLMNAIDAAGESETPVTAAPNFRPLESNWKRNGLNIYSRLLEARMDAYRVLATARALEIARTAESFPPTASWLAEQMRVSEEQLVGGKEYNQARPKGYLRIFNGQKDYDEVMKP